VAFVVDKVALGEVIL